MLTFQIYQCKLKDSMAYGKWYARIVADKTVMIDELAKHMAEHNTAFSPGLIKGVLQDAVACTKELIAEGYRVQWDNLASFGVSIKHKMGAVTPADFSVVKNVDSLKLIAQGIGSFKSSILASAARLKENTTYISPKNPLMGYYTITAKFRNAEEGYVMGSGMYKEGATAVLTAYPNAPEVTQVKWEDGVTTGLTREVTVDKSMDYYCAIVSGGEDMPNPIP